MTIKKAELHVHLEGTISPTLALSLAKKNGLTLPPGLISADNTHYLYKDFLDFLKAYDHVAAVIRKPEDYYDITLDYLRSTSEGGGLYVEMMYSPDHAEMSSGIPSREHLAAIDEAVHTAEEKYNITGRILITAVRHFGPEAALKVARQALKDNVPCVTGFGLGGDEFNYPPKLFKDAYETAHEGGLSCTVHAGEFDSARGMMEAMDHLPIRRIGHGVMAMHCPETMARLKDKNIALEICPSSNIALGLFPDLASHPLKQFLDAGISLSLNSDDPPFFKTCLAEEYSRVQDFYQFTDADMVNFTRMALDAAFVDEKTKNRLLTHVNS